MPSGRPTILLWINEADVYTTALTKAGLTDRVTLQTLRTDENPDPALLAACDAVLAWRAAPGLLGRMPRLRWIQAMTAAVDDWLVRDDLRPEVTLT